MSDMQEKNSGLGNIVVVTMYKFVQLPDYKKLQSVLHEICTRAALKGTLLLAQEGINGTVAGNQQGIDRLLDFLKQDCRFEDLEYKQSSAVTPPFHRMKVRFKKEIVTMGVAGIDPSRLTGKKVNHKEWNKLISDLDVLVLDMRNEYEHKVGTFKNAVSLNLNTFREFPKFVAQRLNVAKDKKIAMFCTGGIRCEKATSYLLQQQFQQVYHLSGGILKYLEDHCQQSEEPNLWQGDCFVFDGRVAVDKDLQAGNYEQCFACRAPLTQEDLTADCYRKGISCPYCIQSLTDKKYARLSARQHQVELAELDGRQHIGMLQKTAKR